MQIDTPEAVERWIRQQPTDVQERSDGRFYVGPLKSSEADFTLAAARTCKTLGISQPELEVTALVSLARCIADYRSAVEEKAAAHAAWQRAAARLDHDDPAHEEYRIRYVAASVALQGADAALAIAERTWATARGELVS